MSWAERRRHDAADHERRLAERRAAEAARARALIEDFLARARETGLRPVPLHARGFDGRGRYRTGLQGWYLRRNETVGIDTEGNFYVLAVPGGLKALLTGQRPLPSDPPLVLGRGGKDGESIDLAEALERVLGSAR